MTTAALKLSELSPPRRRLVRNAYLYLYCTFHQLRIRHREPVWDPPPVIISTIKFGDRFDFPRRPMARDFELKDEWLQLFRLLDEKRDFTIDCLTIDDGLPRLSKQMEVPV